MRLFEAQLAVLSVPPVFDESSGRSVITACSTWLRSLDDRQHLDAIAGLKLAGLIEDVSGGLRIAQPIRNEFRRRLANEYPDVFREVAGNFFAHAHNGSDSFYAAVLGERPAALNRCALGVLGAADEKSIAAPVNELVDVISSRYARGRGADEKILERQLAVLGESPLVARVLEFVRGLDAWHRNRRREAGAHFERVLAESHRDRMAAISGHLYGIALAADGRAEAAETELVRAVEILREFDDERGLAMTLTSLGRNTRTRAQAARTSPEMRARLFAQARELLAEAVAFGAHCDDRVLEGVALLEIARAHRDEGNLVDAVAVAESVRPLVASSPPDLLSCYTLLGSIYRDLGNDQAAGSYLEDAARLALRLGKADLALGQVLNVQASADRRAGRNRDAVRRARESVQIGEQIGNKTHEAHALHTLARALIAIWHVDEAAVHLKKARRLLSEVGDDKGLRMLDNTSRMLSMRRRGRRKR